MSAHPPAQLYSPPRPQTALSGLLPAPLASQPTSRLLEGIDNVEIQAYTGISSLARTLKTQTDRLLATGSGQFAVFCPVTPSQLLALDRKRHVIGKYVRIMYSEEERVMIVKLMPSAGHEAAHITFTAELIYRIASMGISSHEFMGMGSTRFQGNSSSKEADSAMKPTLSRPLKTDWPTLVFESGLSESLQRLRADAAWWLANSIGQVKIVVVIAIDLGAQKLHVERWGMLVAPAGRPATRALAAANNMVPTKLADIEIINNTVAAGSNLPLVLPFHDIFLRLPGPGEGDFVFSANDLQNWSTALWAGLR